METDLKTDRQDMKIEVIKVSAHSSVSAVAGAIANMVRETGKAEVQVVGAGALNQGMKAIIIARGYVAPSGIELVCVPAFTEVTINGAVRTAIRLMIESK